MSKWPSVDTLMQLAKEQPQQLDQLLKNEVEALINSAPKTFQNRLRGLQFEIDCHKELHKTPIQSCIQLSKMMQGSLLKLNNVLNGSHEKEDTERFKKATVIKLEYN